MLLDLIEQQREAHEQEMKTLKESKGIETEESPKTLKTSKNNITEVDKNGQCGTLFGYF